MMKVGEVIILYKKPIILWCFNIVDVFEINVCTVKPSCLDYIYNLEFFNHAVPSIDGT